MHSVSVSINPLNTTLRFFVDIAVFYVIIVIRKKVIALSLGERIKKVRKESNLTQQKFAELVGSTQNALTGYETGRRNPSRSLINNICKTFNVNENWLRTGEGEMFVELPKNEALAAQMQSFLQGGTDSFRERLISLLLRLSPEQWEALEGYLRELTTPQNAAPDRADDDIERKVEDYRRRLVLEKNQADESSPSSEDGTETA